MITHESIWRAIDALAQKYGLSTSGLARKAGLDPTSFNRSKRTAPDGKPRWPSTESLAKILTVTGASLNSFLDIPDAPQPIPVLRMDEDLSDIQSVLNRTKHFRYIDDQFKPEAEQENNIDQSLYALGITNNLLTPLYRSGDRLIVTLDAPEQMGSRVLILLHTGEMIGREIAAYDFSSVTIRPFDRTEITRLPRQDIRWIARILWVSQS